MGVPEEIRQVPRPKNTIVQDSGRDGPKRYSVRERNGVVYIPGCNPQPTNGRTIGYITNGKYVPIVEPKEKGTLAPQMLSYGACALVKSVSDDILDDLLTTFPVDDAYSILAIASLKVVRPGITNSRLNQAYLCNFVSQYYPGVCLSKNTVTKLYTRIGNNKKERESFFEKRMASVAAENHIAIDGTLKQNTSKVNDLSAFSFKARLKGCEDISVLYAYDLEKMEPICSQVFPGNSVDSVSYHAFINDNNVKKGMLIGDKAFTPNKIRDLLEKNPDLHYLAPMKRNDSRISEYKLFEFDGVLTGIDKVVQYKKVKTKDNHYLYTFRDARIAGHENKAYLEKAKKNGTYNPEDYSEKKDSFGVIILESDTDMEPKAAYLAFTDRWKLELVFKAYKSDECMDHTSVQSEFCVIGSEFVNFISTLITCRIIAKATAAGLFNTMTYGELIEDLNSAWRKTDAPKDTLPVTNDEYWVHTINKVSEILEKLGLSVPEEKPEKEPNPRRSRKKAITDGEKTQAEDKHDQTEDKNDQVEKPEKSSQKSRGGRPRKHPLPDPNAPKRPRGRPRTKEPPDPNAPKRPRGRPRKNVLPE